MTAAVGVADFEAAPVSVRGDKSTLVDALLQLSEWALPEQLEKAVPLVETPSLLYRRTELTVAHDDSTTPTPGAPSEEWLNQRGNNSPATIKSTICGTIVISGVVLMLLNILAPPARKKVWQTDLSFAVTKTEYQSEPLRIRTCLWDLSGAKEGSLSGCEDLLEQWLEPSSNAAADIYIVCLQGASQAVLAEVKVYTALLLGKRFKEGLKQESKQQHGSNMASLVYTAEGVSVSTEKVLGALSLRVTNIHRTQDDPDVVPILRLFKTDDKESRDLALVLGDAGAKSLEGSPKTPNVDLASLNVIGDQLVLKAANGTEAQSQDYQTCAKATAWSGKQMPVFARLDVRKGAAQQ